MAMYLSLRCNQGESALARIERAKLPSQEPAPLPADAYKGPIQRDRFGWQPAPGNVNILGDVTEFSGKISYYICQRK
jgi:hypothetical protein